MGGDYYEREVVSSTTSYSAESSKVVGVIQHLHPSCDPKQYKDDNLKSENRHPIVFALDVTGSMGDWSKIIYDKMPMFYGQIMMQKYLTDPSISFCAVGDSTCDKAPLQVTGFGQGKEIDEQISKIFLEGGGGGGYYESYELPAYFYNYDCTLIDAELPFFFITGDECFYEEITTKTIENLVGKGLKAKKSVKSRDVWKELMQKFNTFLIKKPYSSSSSEKEILKQWVSTLGDERVLMIHTPKACIDVILGAIAITSGTRTLDTYIQDMKTRGQTEDRIEEVSKALEKYNKAYISQKIHRVYKHIDKVDQVENLKAGSKGEVNKEDMIELLELYEKLELSELSTDQIAYKDKLKEIKKILKDSVPNEFICPLTKEIYFQPVMTSDGQTYEKKAIQLWLEKSDVSPATGLVLENKMTIDNNIVKQLINDYFNSVKDSI